MCLGWKGVHHSQHRKARNSNVALDSQKEDERKLIQQREAAAAAASKAQNATRRQSTGGHRDRGGRPREAPYSARGQLHIWRTYPMPYAYNPVVIFGIHIYRVGIPDC
jgi:hypothetical protein